MWAEIESLYIKPDKESDSHQTIEAVSLWPNGSRRNYKQKMVKLVETKTTAEKMQLNLKILKSLQILVKAINNNNRNVLNPEGHPRPCLIPVVLG